jgi:hypothetical protein
MTSVARLFKFEAVGRASPLPLTLKAAPVADSPASKERGAFSLGAPRMDHRSSIASRSSVSALTFAVGIGRSGGGRACSEKHKRTRAMIPVRITTFSRVRDGRPANKGRRLEPGPAVPQSGLQSISPAFGRHAGLFVPAHPTSAAGLPSPVEERSGPFCFRSRLVRLADRVQGR